VKHAADAGRDAGPTNRAAASGDAAVVGQGF
jgi:hypothetical protein